jgi:hypothetical protein
LNRLYSLILFFFIIIEPSFAQFPSLKNPDDSELVLNTIDLIYNLEFEKVALQLPKIKSRFPNHPMFDMLSAMSLYWQMVFINKDDPRFTTYAKHLENVIYLSEKMLEKKGTVQEATYFLIAAHSSNGVIFIKLKDYGKAISEARKAYKYMKNGFEYKKTNHDFHLSTGLYNYYVVQYPETHPILKPFMWFFPSGDKTYGINELAKGFELGTFSKIESAFFSAHIHLKYENKPEKALPYTKWLMEKFPNNQFYKIRHIEALISTGKWEASLPFLKSLESETHSYFKMAVSYFNGQIAENQNDIRLAKQYYFSSIELALKNKIKTSDFLGLSYWRLAQIFEKEKNKQKADIYYTRADDTVEYFHAQKDVKRYFSKK